MQRCNAPQDIDQSFQEGHEYSFHVYNAIGPPPLKSTKSGCTRFFVWTGRLGLEYAIIAITTRDEPILGGMEVPQWKPLVARSLIYTSTAGRSTVADYLNCQLPPELAIRQAQVPLEETLSQLISTSIGCLEWEFAMDRSGRPVFGDQLHTRASSACDPVASYN